MNSIAPQLLLRVPGCESGEPPRSARPLAGGRGVNSVWRVQTRAGDFVLRLRHPPLDRPGSISRFELDSHRLAAAAGLAPPVVNAAADGHWLVMEYIDAPIWTDAQLLSDAGIDSLGGALQCLHALDCHALPRMDACAVARDYLELITARHPGQACDAALELEAIEQSSRELAPHSDRAALNHGDLMAANLIGPDPGSGPAPLLVDWEYAQSADPTWDIACLLAYYPGLEARLARLQAACGLQSAEDRQILSLQRQVFGGLNRLWQLSESGNWIS